MATHEASPLSTADVTRIMDHMNDDHGDAVLLYAQHFGGIEEATSARMVDMGKDVMELEVTTPTGVETVTLQLIEDVHNATEARQVLVEMARIAREGASGGSS
ncbi:MAG: DUF2470 domain-containing protein [Bacteroidetes bacterium]|jgi:putative heme iron utilization protein|nr:DUF2470 domain-containing protein [Bacteroidota bacterium]